MPRTLVASLLLALGLLACGEDDLCADEGEEEHEHEGTASGATCDGSTLTYENFGKEFMDKYCTRCHSSSLEGDARNCAPSDHNFDSLDEINFYWDHIDEHAAAGPDSVNTEMPPSGVTPTEQERRDLGTWLACEQERMP